MSAVAGAGPLHYLVLIDAVDALRSLYGRVLVCESVVRELKASALPYVVRSWMGRPLSGASCSLILH